LKFYIAHRITSRHYIRDTVCPLLRKSGYTIFNPFYKVNKKPRKTRIDIGFIDRGEVNPYNIKSSNGCKEIVDKDLKLINQSDGIICFMDVASIGASMELFYCAYVLKKPIFIVSEKYIGHPWLVTFASLSGGFIVTTINKLIKGLKKKYE